MPRTRPRLAFALAAILFVVTIPAITPAELYLRRESLRLAEVAGIMHTDRGLGGQILGYNYYRHPISAHWGAQIISASLATALPLTGAFFLYRRISGAAHATHCAHCGTNIDKRAGLIRTDNNLCCPRCHAIVNAPIANGPTP